MDTLTCGILPYHLIYSKVTKVELLFLVLVDLWLLNSYHYNEKKITVFSFLLPFLSILDSAFFIVI